MKIRGAYLERLGARSRQRLGHLLQDVQPTLPRLLQRLLHDLVEPFDLDVHLDRGDAPLGAGDLEVHVAEVILGAQDVGEDSDLVAFLDEAHATPAQDAFIGTPASISASDRRIPSPSRPFDSRTSETTRSV